MAEEQPKGAEMSIEPATQPGQPTPDEIEAKEHPIVERGWKFGFWDCFSDPATCCLTYCCPCVVYGMVRSTFKGTPDSCVQDSAIFFLSAYCCLAPALGAINRYEMREKYHITGLHKHDSAKKYFDEAKNKEVLGKKDGNGFISDLVTWYCCGICALCQEKREVDALHNSGEI